MKKHEVHGLCGRYCSICQFFEKECRGCPSQNLYYEEQIEKGDKTCSVCLVFQCAKDKGVDSCLSCPVTVPRCNLMNAVAKAYCPVASSLKDWGEKLDHGMSEAQFNKLKKKQKEHLKK